MSREAMWLTEKSLTRDGRDWQVVDGPIDFRAALFRPMPHARVDVQVNFRKIYRIRHKYTGEIITYQQMWP